MRILKKLLKEKLQKKQEPINRIEIRDIKEEPYFLINESFLFHARTGEIKKTISEEDAIYIANNYMKEGLEISNVETIYETGKHHEYREKLLPAYVINYKSRSLNLRQVFHTAL